MIESAVMLLPQPDSPTSATVSPGCTEKLRSRRTLTGPARVANSTERALTARTGSIIAPAASGSRRH